MQQPPMSQHQQQQMGTQQMMQPQMQQQRMVQPQQAMIQTQNPMMPQQNTMIQGQNTMIQPQNAMIQGQNAMIQTQIPQSMIQQQIPQQALIQAQQGMLQQVQQQNRMIQQQSGMIQAQPGMIQHQQSVIQPQLQQMLGQQMMFCPVRVVYDTPVLVQQGDQIQQQAQNLFINPQNTPPWARPIQNQFIYVHQMPSNIQNNVMPVQPIDPQIYMQQNFTNFQQLPQMIAQNTQEQLRMIPNMVTNNMVQNNIISNTLQSGGVVNRVNNMIVPNPATSTNNMPSNVPNSMMANNVQNNTGHATQTSSVPTNTTQTAVNNVPSNIVQTGNMQNVANIQTPNNQNQQQVPKMEVNIQQQMPADNRQVINQNANQKSVEQQTQTVYRNVPINAIRTQVPINQLQNMTQNFQAMHAMGPIQNLRQMIPGHLVASMPQALGEVKVAATHTLTDNTVTYSAVRNGQPYTFRAIQPKPPQYKVFSPIPQMQKPNFHAKHPMIPNYTQNIRPNSPVTNTKTEATNVNMNRKRKSESPDEIQKKVAVSSTNYGSMTITAKTKDKIIAKAMNTSEIGTNTSPVHKRDEKKALNNQYMLQINPMEAAVQSEDQKQNIPQLIKMNNNESVPQSTPMDTSDQINEEKMRQMMEKEKMIRNTVFPQARGRVLNDKLVHKTEETQTNIPMVPNVVTKVESGMQTEKIQNFVKMDSNTFITDQTKILRDLLSTANAASQCSDVDMKPVAETTRPIETSKPVTEKVRPVAETVQPMPEIAKPMPSVGKSMPDIGSLTPETTKSIEMTQPLPEMVKPIPTPARSMPEITPIPEVARTIPDTNRSMPEIEKSWPEKVPPLQETENPVKEPMIPMKNTTPEIKKVKTPKTEPKHKEEIKNLNKTLDVTTKDPEAQIKINIIPFKLNETAESVQHEIKETNMKLINEEILSRKNCTILNNMTEAASRHRRSLDNEIDHKNVQNVNLIANRSEESIKKTALVNEDVKQYEFNVNTKLKPNEDVSEKKETEYKNISANDIKGREIHMVGGNIVKEERSYVLTHVLDGYVIQESNVPFAIRKPLKEKTINMLIEEKQDAIKEEGKQGTSSTAQTSTEDLEVKEKIVGVAEVKENIPEISQLNLNEVKKEDAGHVKKEEGVFEEVDGKSRSDNENPFADLKARVVKTWTTEDLSSHLLKYNWTETVAILSEHEIDGESLLLVSASQLAHIGVNETHVNLICDFVNNKRDR